MTELHFVDMYSSPSSIKILNSLLSILYMVFACDRTVESIADLSGTDMHLKHSICVMLQHSRSIQSFSEQHWSKCNVLTTS